MSSYKNPIYSTWNPLINTSGCRGSFPGSPRSASPQTSHRHAARPLASRLVGWSFWPLGLVRSLRCRDFRVYEYSVYVNDSDYMALSLFADLWSFNCPFYRFYSCCLQFNKLERPKTYTGRVVRGLSRQSQNGKNATGSLSGAGFHPIEPLQISQNRKSMDIFTSPLKRDQNKHLWNHFVCDSVGMCYNCLAWMANASPKKWTWRLPGFQPIQSFKALLHHRGDSSVEPPRQDLSLEMGPSWLGWYSN